MRTFDCAPEAEQSALMICLFTLAMVSLFHLIAFSDKGGRRRNAACSAGLLTALGILLSVLGDAFDRAQGGIALSLPMGALWATAGGAGMFLAVQTGAWFRARRHSLGRRSVKQAIDTLPSAVAYFEPSGAVKLCNLQMHRLFRVLAQCDLQTIDELRLALEECDERSGVIRLSDERQTYLFPDGRAWRCEQKRVTASDGVAYTEVVFSNVTEQYEKGVKLRQQTRRLEKLSRDLKRFSDNVHALAREKEILAAKTRLHDQMGAGMLAVRKVLQQSSPSEETEDAIRLFRKAVSTIKNDNEGPEDSGEFEEFMRDAETIGVTVEVTGELPRPERARRVFVTAMRECLTNGVRHADATALRIQMTEGGGAYGLRVTNDGRPPEREVVPKGGLLNLRRHVVGVGGTMDIQSEPVFALTVTVPARREAAE